MTTTKREGSIMMDVDSTAVTSLGHSKVDNSLFIKFPSGEWYRYFNVPCEVYDHMINAQSFFRWLYRYLFWYDPCGVCGPNGMICHRQRNHKGVHEDVILIIGRPSAKSWENKENCLKKDK